MTRYISLLVPLLLIHMYGNSQKVDKDSVLFKIKIKITTFFIEQGVLDKSVCDDTANYVFAYELLEKKMIGFNTTGVYRIGVLHSHSNQHILIKEDANVRIFNLKDIDLLLRELLDYRIRHNIEIKKMLLYFSNIIEMYKHQYKD